MRATTRLADVAFNSVVKLLIDAGRACRDYQDRAFRELNCKRLQLDEIWSFVYAKAKNVPDAKAAREIAGDVWTWVAIDVDTKLVPSWLVGERSGETARMFVADLAARLAGRVQITTDGHKAYLEAIDAAFGIDVDYAVLEKMYASPVEGQKRCSPPVCFGAKRNGIVGRPDQDHISTPFVERQNLTMRMSIRRFTRLTNAFSKKIENHAFAISLHYMDYNFARQHRTLRVSPAMAAGVADRLWSVADIVDVVDANEAKQKSK